MVADGVAGHDIVVQYAVKRRGVPHARSLRRWARSALGRTRHTVCLRIVGAAESRRLNRIWRGKDNPTNVLSFPSGSSVPDIRAPRHLPLGDLAICAPVVAREAHEQGKTVNAHWAHMVVHGVLHLLGYDHVRERDATAMEALEVKLLARLGFADPYATRYERLRPRSLAD